METKLEVSDKVISETVNCEKDFSCLKSEYDSLCKVTVCISNSIHFLDCKSSPVCNYKLLYADSYICLCPTRKEIFNKFKK